MMMLMMMIKTQIIIKAANQPETGRRHHQPDKLSQTQDNQTLWSLWSSPRLTKKDTNKNRMNYVDNGDNVTWYKLASLVKKYDLIQRGSTEKNSPSVAVLQILNLSIGHRHCCGFQKNILAFFGELWHNLERGNPIKHKSCSLHRQSQRRIFITLMVSLTFPLLPPRSCMTGPSGGGAGIWQGAQFGSWSKIFVAFWRGSSLHRIRSWYICCALSSVHMIVLVTLGSDALDRSHWGHRFAKRIGLWWWGDVFI